MLQERFNLFSKNQHTHPAVISIANHIIEELDGLPTWHIPPKFTPLALFVFGSVLDECRFDREGKGLSDLDFFAVVAENFFADDVRLIGMHCTPSNIYNFVMLRHMSDSDNDWSKGRNVDVLLVSPEWITWEFSRVEPLDDQAVRKELTDDAYLNALVSSHALFNHLDDRFLRGFLRLRRLYVTSTDTRRIRP